MTEPRTVIRRPIMTEKSMRGAEVRKYTFEVADGADKISIKRAVEELFEVSVRKVNTITIPGQRKRRGPHYYHARGYKKAVVTLAPGQKIDLESLG